MAIEYVIDYECEAKRELTTEGLIACLKAQGRAETLIPLMREDDPNKPIEEMVVEQMILTPDGVEQKQEVRISDLLAQAESLKSYEPACAECPASGGGEPFGCVGAVNYPFSAMGEQWLMAQLPQSLDSLVGTFLKRGKEDMQWEGAAFAAMRRAGDTFFQLRRPPERSWGRLFGKFTITADELYQPMFQVASITPVHGAMLCFIFGALDEAALPQVVTEQDLSALPAFRFEPTPETEETAAQLQCYFGALYTAATLDVTVTVDF